jgi:isopenicillin N synthase-like dioxygenase
VPSALPIIDVGPLVQGSADLGKLPAQLDTACRESGFFYVRNHGVGEQLQARLEALSRRFFALPLERKLAIAMSRGGRAWRGYFPVGSELTSGRPDLKEGIYFGSELSADDPRVLAQVPLHGPNVFPPDVPELEAAVLELLPAMTRLGHALMEGISAGLGLERTFFRHRFMDDPLILFRIFNYPASDREDCGVGEHSDYGVLTLLRQDDVGGLEIKCRGQWIEAPPVPGTFVCNIGDMLERMTGGDYCSTPHRVVTHPTRDRLSFPFFFDPAFDARVGPIRPGRVAPDDARERWDGASVHAFEGTYGDYLLAKVAKVFPGLCKEVLPKRA